jgi:TFIIF-interacting CTD phosphatase-like protein
MTKKFNVVLDLDQTLISAEETDSFKMNKDKMKKFTYHDMDGYYNVFERPGLQKFLDWLFANAIVSVWTAASKDYALFIVDKIILKGRSDRKIEWFFFANHCSVSKKNKRCIKDLSMLWDVYQIPGFTAENTVIVDDNDEVYRAQPKLVIRAPPFEYKDRSSHRDDWLMKKAKPWIKKEMVKFGSTEQLD